MLVKRQKREMIDHRQTLRGLYRDALFEHYIRKGYSIHEARSNVGKFIEELYRAYVL